MFAAAGSFSTRAGIVPGIITFVILLEMRADTLARLVGRSHMRLLLLQRLRYLTRKQAPGGGLILQLLDEVISTDLEERRCLRDALCCGGVCMNPKSDVVFSNKLAGSAVNEDVLVHFPLVVFAVEFALDPLGLDRVLFDLVDILCLHIL